MKSLHISLNTAQSGCKPCHPSQILFKSSYCSPTSPPATSTFLLADTQSSTLHHTLYTQDCINPLCFLSFSDTPHIHLTIIHSVLSRLRRFSVLFVYAFIMKGLRPGNILQASLLLNSFESYRIVCAQRLFFSILWYNELIFECQRSMHFKRHFTSDNHWIIL